MQVFTTFAGYSFEQIFVKAKENEDLTGANELMTIFSQYFLLFMMSWAGGSTAAKAKRTMTIVSRMLVNAEGKEEHELKKFLMQIRSRNLKFENVLFVINWKLVVKTTCGIITYMAITYQAIEPIIDKTDDNSTSLFQTRLFGHPLI